MSLKNILYKLEKFLINLKREDLEEIHSILINKGSNIVRNYKPFLLNKREYLKLSGKKSKKKGRFKKNYFT